MHTISLTRHVTHAVTPLHEVPSRRRFYLNVHSVTGDVGGIFLVWAMKILQEIWKQHLRLRA